METSPTTEVKSTPHSPQEITRARVDEARVTLIAEYCTKWDIEPAAHCLDRLKACYTLTGLALEEGLKKAKIAFEFHYLAQWSKGEIAKKNKVMTEKETLKFRESINEYRKNLGMDLISDEEFEKHVAERNEAKLSGEKLPTMKQIHNGKEPEKAPEEVVVKPVKEKKHAVVPVWKDAAAQAEKLAKYPWAIKDSFKSDPEAPNSTNVDIKCQVPSCPATRTIHLADLFQVKKCAEHTAKKK